MFSEQAAIINMDIVDKKARRLYTKSQLASGGPGIDGYSIVDIVYDGRTASFVNRLNCEEINRITRPKDYTVFDIEIMSDSSIIRSEPIALDTPFNYVLELPGNQLGKITKEAKATVIGHHMDTLGTNWYFALIWPKYKIKKYVYGYDSTVKSYSMAWVNASEGRIN